MSDLLASHADVAIATAIFLTITQVGGAVGGSIAGAVWSTSLPRRLAHHLPSSEQRHIPSIIASLPYALSFPSGSATRIAINKAYVDVQKVLNGLAMAMLVPGLLSMCAMKDVNLGKDDQGGEGVVVLGRASFLGACRRFLSASQAWADVMIRAQPAKTSSPRAKLPASSAAVPSDPLLPPYRSLRRSFHLVVAIFAFSPVSPPSFLARRRHPLHPSRYPPTCTSLRT